MQVQRILVNGDRAVVTVPDAAALPDAVATGVLYADGNELEVNTGSTTALAFFLDSTGTTLSADLTLRSGATMTVGPRGGDAASGQCYSVAVGRDRLFGFSAPATSVETLAGWLSQVELRPLRAGIAARPTGAVGWSPYRTFSVAQQVALTDGTSYLLDLRRVRAGRAPKRKDGTGIPVRGGVLSRSAPAEEQPHVVLESEAFVSYGIPLGPASLDRVATSMAQVTTVLA